MPFPNFHAMRLRPVGIFSKDTFRTTTGGTLFGGKLNVPATINLIWAKMNGTDSPDDPPLLQAIRFNKSHWTPTSAKAWVKKHLSQRVAFEPATSKSEANSTAITEQKLTEGLLLGDLEAYNTGEPMAFEELEGMEVIDYDEEDVDNASTLAATLSQLMTQEGIQETNEITNDDAITDSQSLMEEEDSKDDDKEAETQDVKDVEIFATGKWGTESYTPKDLDLLVANFEQLKDEIKPPNKLGHGKQSLLESAGLPAAGWVTALRRVGTKLVADFSDIPARIARIINNKGYKRVSVEIYNNYQDSKGKRRGLVLKALAFLGGDIPAVKTLEDVEVLYADEPFADNPYRRVTLMADLTKDTLEEEVVEEVVEETEELEEEEKEVVKEAPVKEEIAAESPVELEEPKVVVPAELIKRQDDLEKKLATATGLIAALQKTNQAQQEAMAMAESESFIDGLAKDGKFPPALKDKAVAMMGALRSQEGEVLTYSEGDVDVEITPLALFQDMLNELSTVIEMSELGAGSNPKKPGSVPDVIKGKAFQSVEGYNVVGAELLEAVQILQEANPDLSYPDALLQVAKEQS